MRRGPARRSHRARPPCRSIAVACPPRTTLHTTLLLTDFYLLYLGSSGSLSSSGTSDRSSPPASSGFDVLSTWRKLPNLSRGRFTMRRPLNPTTLTPTCFVNDSNVPTAPPIVDECEALPVCR